MYIGVVPRAKQACEKILDEGENVIADYILEAIACSLEAIKLLEDACNSQYAEGKAYGMERMAEILCGSERSE
jgi:hypothetical protein